MHLKQGLPRSSVRLSRTAVLLFHKVPLFFLVGQLEYLFDVPIALDVDPGRGVKDPMPNYQNVDLISKNSNKLANIAFGTNSEN